MTIRVGMAPADAAALALARKASRLDRQRRSAERRAMVAEARVDALCEVLAESGVAVPWRDLALDLAALGER